MAQDFAQDFPFFGQPGGADLPAQLLAEEMAKEEVEPARLAAQAGHGPAERSGEAIVAEPRPGLEGESGFEAMEEVGPALGGVAFLQPGLGPIEELLSPGAIGGHVTPGQRAFGPQRGGIDRAGLIQAEVEGAAASAEGVLAIAQIGQVMGQSAAQEIAEPPFGRIGRGQRPAPEEMEHEALGKIVRRLAIVAARDDDGEKGPSIKPVEFFLSPSDAFGRPSRAGKNGPRGVGKEALLLGRIATGGRGVHAVDFSEVGAGLARREEE